MNGARRRGEGDDTDMERLNTAVFYSTPSVLCVLLLYVALPERAFLLAAAIGGRTPTHMRSGIMGIVLILDTLLVLSMLIGLSRHCQPRLRYNKIECQAPTVYCAGFQTGVVLVMITLLFLDRVTMAFSLKHTDRSLSWRCTHSAVLGIAYTTLTHDFQSVMVLIAIAALKRYTKLAPDETSPQRRWTTRAIAAYLGLVVIDAFMIGKAELSPTAKKSYAVAFASIVITLCWSR